MNADYIRKLNIKLVGIVTLALIISLSVIIVVSLQLAEKYIVPELKTKAFTQGQVLTTLIGQPLSYQINISELVGVSDLFKGVIEDNPEFGFLAISDVQGKILYHFGDPLVDASAYMSSKGLLNEAGQLVATGGKLKSASLGKHHVVSLPIFSTEHSIIGLLHIGIKASYVQNILNELLLDLAVILVVSLFVAFEVLYFISGGKQSGQFDMLCRTIGAAINNDFTQRGYHAGRDELGRVAALIDAAINKINERYVGLVAKARNSGVLTPEMIPDKVADTIGIKKKIRFGEPGNETQSYSNYLGTLRAPLFLSLMAEDLSRSFIPLFTKQLYVPAKGISAEFILGMPIMVFMLLVAVLQPVLAGWSERIGRKQSLLIGMLTGCFAFVMTANAFSIYDLLLWRALSGVSWAIVFVASQGLILDKATANTRTRDIAFFVGVIMVSSLCGPPIGGILADNLGFRATFYVSAGLSLVAVIVLLRFLEGDTNVSGLVQRKLRLLDIVSVLSNWRFLLLILTAGIPAKIALIGICFYLIPLYVTHLGDSSAMAGRVLMLYGLVMVIGVPIAARISDHMRKRKEFIGVGLILSGITGFFVLLGNNIFVPICIVLLLGLAQAISIAPQTAFVADICNEEITRLGEGTVYGVYRLMERIGNVLGPILAALMLNFFGFKGAFGSIGLLLIVSGIVFAAVFRQSDDFAILATDAEGVEQ
ncbi:MAG: MFS transporter [Desulfuromonadales bacterium]